MRKFTLIVICLLSGLLSQAQIKTGFSQSVIKKFSAVSNMNAASIGYITEKKDTLYYVSMELKGNHLDKNIVLWFDSKEQLIADFKDIIKFYERGELQKDTHYFLNTHEDKDNQFEYCKVFGQPFIRFPYAYSSNTYSYLSIKRLQKILDLLEGEQE